MKRSTWILLAIVLALGAVVFFWERKVPTTDELRESKDHVLVVKKDEVRELKRSGTQPLHLVKESDEWKLIAPVKDAADRYGVEGFLERLGNTRVIRRLKIKPGSGKYGLKTPNLTLTVSGDGFSHILKLGKKASLSGTYASVDSSLVVVPDEFAKLLRKPVADFRLKDLLPFGTDRVGRCSIERGGEKLAFSRSDDGQWRITAPFSDRGDANKLQELLDDVCLCPVFSFKNGTMSRDEAGLATPWLKVSLELKDGSKAHVEFGSDVKGGDPKKKLVYASTDVRPSIMEISRNSLRFLGKKPSDYRSMDLFRHALYDAEEVSIHGYRNVAIKRDKKKEWKFSEPEEVPETADASMLAADLSSLNAVGIARGDRKSLGLMKPAYTIEIKGKGFQDTLEIGVKVNGDTFAVPGGRKVILRLDAKSWSRLEKSIRLSTRKKDNNKKASSK